MAVLVCVDCGQEFKGHNKVKRCPDCTPRADFQNECEVCGELFYPSRFAGKRQRVCGYECSCKEGWRTPAYTYVCRYCGESYMTAHKERDQYCCREHAFADISSWNNSPMILEATATIECVRCGKEVLQVDAHNNTCCSEECYLAHYRRACDVCGSEFIALTSAHRLCSDECRAEDARRAAREASIDSSDRDGKTVRCAHCGKEFVMVYGDKRRTYCSARCSRRAGRMNRRHRTRGNIAGQVARRRAREVKPVGSSHVYRSRIFERDGWRCQICGKKVDKTLKWPHKMSATIDHIIPLAKGGAHVPKNCQLAHFICNSTKSDNLVGDQLRLFG